MANDKEFESEVENLENIKDSELPEQHHTGVADIDGTLRRLAMEDKPENADLPVDMPDIRRRPEK